MCKRFVARLLALLLIGLPAVAIAQQPVRVTNIQAVGASNYSFLSTAAVQAANIKSSAGTVWDVQCFNHGTTKAYIRLYNQTASPGTGDTANIVWRGTVPASADGGGFVVQFPNGRQFSTGIGIRVSGSGADNDATALVANDVRCNVGYQ